jgi:hypothetical protein
MRNTVDRAPAHDRSVGASSVAAIRIARRFVLTCSALLDEKTPIARVAHWERSAASLHVADRGVSGTR